MREEKRPLVWLEGLSLAFFLVTCLWVFGHKYVAVYYDKFGTFAMTLAFFILWGAAAVICTMAIVYWRVGRH